MFENQTPKNESESFDDQDDVKRVSDVTVDTELARFSDLVIDDVDFQISGEVASHSTIKAILQKKTVEPLAVSPVLLKKAVNWLITFCWTKDYSDQILWTSIGYFYAYVNSKFLKKERLTVLLLTMVNVAIKLLEPSKALTVHDLEHVLLTSSDKESFVLFQQELLELLDFDLYFGSNLSAILTSGVDCQKTDQILFLCEVLFMGSFEAAISSEYLTQIVKLVHAPETSNMSKIDLQKLSSNEKYFQNTKLKYSSKFDVDRFWKEIIG